jgi:transposase
MEKIYSCKRCHERAAHNPGMKIWWPSTETKKTLLSYWSLKIGTDMNRFPSASHLAKWARLCPGNHESAGKRLPGLTGRNTSRLTRSIDL